MKPLQLFDPASSTYTYILFDADTRDALLIDPVDDQLSRDLAALREHGLKLVWTVETHAHADHITSAGLLAEHTGAKTAAPAGPATRKWRHLRSETLSGGWRVVVSGAEGGPDR